MTPTARTTARALLALALVFPAAVGPAPRAAATDLETVRQRAQRVADEVTELERRLQELRARREELGARIDATDARIGRLETEIGRNEQALAAAHSGYVARAVEAYKDGPAADLALLLTARDLASLQDAAEAVGNAAEADVRALRELLAAVGALERSQASLDERKQELLADQAATTRVTAAIEDALSARRATLARLDEEVARLERLARIRAARAADPDAAFAELLAPAGPAAEIPDGYVGTGIVFEGIASWYGPGFEGDATASGQLFDPRLYTAASRDLPFGTLLFVRYGGRGVVVVVNDRGPYIEERILDLSQAAAEALGLGLGWVTAEIVVPEP